MLINYKVPWRHSAPRVNVMASFVWQLPPPPPTHTHTQHTHTHPNLQWIITSLQWLSVVNGKFAFERIIYIYSPWSKKRNIYKTSAVSAFFKRSKQTNVVILTESWWFHTRAHSRNGYNYMSPLITAGRNVITRHPRLPLPHDGTNLAQACQMSSLLFVRSKNHSCITVIVVK